ncbi:MAG: efflux RND transporter periplasmic adaptor subunit [Acidobacteria bacterium]|nr:efflux RND transporter periplasmic adaptor subunit [Acidobacteriota bacterium]
MNEDENLNNEEEVSTAGEVPRNTKLIAAIAGGAVVVLLTALAIWYFAFAGDGTAGKPVPAPRSFPTAPSESQPLTGQTLTIGAEQRENAGLVIETVGEQLAAELGLTAATGVVEPNAYRNTPVLPLVGGVVRSIGPELGDQVSRGQTVAVVFSNEFADAQSRYVALLTEAENARRNFERTQRLVAINQPGRTEFDNATRNLRVAESTLVEMEAGHHRITRLVEIGAASVEEFEKHTTKLRTAEAEVAEARNRYDRAGRLLEINPETRSQNEEALNKLRAAEGELASARQRLVLYGMSDAKINALRSPSQIRSEMEVPAPVSGTVTTRTANPGEVVDANKELIRVTDLSTVWVIAQAFERDLPKLRTGSGASVTTNAFPDRLFRGQVTYIDPAIDPATRTAKVRVEIANGDRALRLGMFVNVAFGALQQSERTVPVVPAAAVQMVNGRQTVFLATADPNVFELRQVSLGSETNGRYAALEGVNVGDRIVTTGSFLLRAEWVKLNPSN